MDPCWVQLAMALDLTNVLLIIKKTTQNSFAHAVRLCSLRVKGVLMSSPGARGHAPNYLRVDREHACERSRFHMNGVTSVESKHYSIIWVFLGQKFTVTALTNWHVEYNFQETYHVIIFFRIYVMLVRSSRQTKTIYMHVYNIFSCPLQMFSCLRPCWWWEFQMDAAK